MEKQSQMDFKTKRNWGGYLLEFLMLFLAVFLGFVAENIRENKADRETEKQYVQSYIDDLKSDTAAISRNIRYRRDEKAPQLDSLMWLLGAQKIKGHEGDLYYLTRMMVRTKRFQSNDRTIIQLRSSGALRLIRNEQAIDSLISYQRLVELISVNLEDDRQERNKAYDVAIKMFDPFVFDGMVNMNGIDRPRDNPPLRSYDRNIQLDLAAYAHIIKGSNYLIELRLQWLHTKAKNLIELLQKEYKIE